MPLPHILAYLGRTLYETKLVSFTNGEEKEFKKMGIFNDVWLPKVSRAYRNGALELLRDVQMISDSAPSDPMHPDYYRTQIRITKRVQTFDRLYGLEKRLTGQQAS